METYDILLWSIPLLFLLGLGAADITVLQVWHAVFVAGVLSCGIVGFLLFIAPPRETLQAQ